jgi:hypothetical protein
MQQAEIVPIFSWTHYATDGKLDNITAVIDDMQSILHIGLHILDPGIDEPLLDEEEILSRLARVKKVTAKLKRHHSLQAELILPGILTGLTFEPAAKKRLQFLYAHATQTGTKTIWADDSFLGKDDVYLWYSPEALKSFNKTKKYRLDDLGLHQALYADSPSAKVRQIQKDWMAFKKTNLRSLAVTIQKAVRTQTNSIKVGLISGLPSAYDFVFTPDQLAEMLAGQHEPRYVRFSQFSLDEDRTDILGTILSGIRNAAGGCLVNYASNFHKAAETMQMEINLNLLHGNHRIFLDAFDRSGTAPTEENPYLKMIGNREKMVDKLFELLPENPRPVGLRVIQEEGEESDWSSMLLRMGFPIMIETPETNTVESTPAANVLSVDACKTLKRNPLNMLFAQGVLIDAGAAKILQERGFGDLLGVDVGGPIADVLFEIISYQAFAAPYYGHRTQLAGSCEPNDFKLLTPTHPKSQTITTLLRRGQSPTTPGMSLYDDPEKDRRCVILPYGLDGISIDPLLTIQRQRHFLDVLINLAEAPLPCFVENAPDLVPFYVPHPNGRRSVLALLNLSFDWAIDTRIRLGQLPKRVKKVRELSDDGKLEQYKDFPIHRDGAYTYLQLTPDTAIPPMQMGIFVLD